MSHTCPRTSRASEASGNAHRYADAPRESDSRSAHDAAEPPEDGTRESRRRQAVRALEDTVAAGSVVSIVLEKNGGINEGGTYSRLLSSNATFWNSDRCAECAAGYGVPSLAQKRHICN